MQRLLAEEVTKYVGLFSLSTTILMQVVELSRAGTAARSEGKASDTIAGGT